MIENFWERVKKRMEVPKKKKVALTGAALETIGEIPYFGLSAKFGKAYKDELGAMAQEGKIDEILKIVKETNSKVIYNNLRIKVKDEALKKFINELVPHLKKINSKLDILLEDHKRIEDKETIMLAKMEKMEAMIAQLQDGLLRNPTIMKQISNYGMPLPKPYESFLSHSSEVLNSTTNLANQGNYKEALEELSKLEKERKEEIRRAIAEKRVFIWISARIDFQTGLIKQAEGLFADSISLFKSTLTQAFEIKDYEIVTLAYYELGYSYGEINDFQNGYESTQKAVEFAGSYYTNFLPYIHFNLGFLLDELGRKEEAEKAYREVIRYKPAQASAHSNLGNLLAESGRKEEAEKEYREAIRIKPDYADAHYNLGFLLDDLGNKEEAERQYREAIKWKPNFASSHYNLSVLLVEGKRKEGAEKELREAIKWKPDHSSAHYNLAKLLENLGREEEAEIEYRECIKHKPDHVSAHNNLGTLLADLGRHNEAEKELKEAIKIKPDHSSAHYNLGKLLAELGRKSEAELSYKEALKFASSDGIVYASLGYLYNEMGRKEEAIIMLEKALKFSDNLSNEDISVINEDLRELEEKRK